MIKRAALLSLLTLTISLPSHAGEALPAVTGIAETMEGPRVAVIVHPGSPVAALAPEQVKALFNGHMRAFPSTSEMVTLLDHPMESIRYRDFYQLVFNSPPERVQRRRAAYLFSGKGILPDTVEDDEAVIRKVLENPSAIGYVDPEKVDDRVKVVCIIPP